MKIFRWKYIIPRLAFVAILCLAVHFGLDPLLRWAVITSGESAVGAKVELANVRTALWDGELVLEGLAIANPQSPMKNLLEANESQLLVDVNALLHGRVVVTDGKLSGLQFDTDRQTSGALEQTETDETSGPSMFAPLLGKADQLGDEWLNSVGDRLSSSVVDQLRSPALAKELQERWPSEYEQLKGQVADIRQRSKELEKSIREVKSNPLRGLQRLPELQAELSGLQTQVKTVQKKIGNLPKQAEADKAAVLAARQQDEALIRQQLQFKQVDGAGLTQILLGKPVNEGLASALGWIAWARQQVHTSPTKEKTGRSRGTTVLFTPPQPGYLVKRIELEGSASLNGQPLQLVGTLTDVCDAPRLLGEPTRLNVHGSEALELDLELVVDRRGEVPEDRLLLTCPSMAMTARSLGNAEKLAIDMGPGLANLRVELSLVGEQLSGEIMFEQESLELTPRLAKQGQLAEVLGGALAGVNRLAANVELTGTLQKPEVAIRSDLGDQVAAGLNGTVQRLLQHQTDALVAKTRQQVDGQLQKLTQMRDEAQQKLLAQLGEGQELLGQLAALTGGEGSGLGGIPQIGSKLRLDGLRK